MTAAATATASRAQQGASQVGSAATGAAPTATDGAMSAIARQVVGQVGPQVAGRVLDVAAQRASTTIDNLTARLEAVAAEGGTRGAGGLKAALTGKAPAPASSPGPDAAPDQDGESEKLSVPSRVRAGLGFVVEQAIQLLELIKQWVTRLIAATQQWLGLGSTGADDTDRSGDDEPGDDPPHNGDDPDEDEQPESDGKIDAQPRARSGSRNRPAARK